MNLIYYPKATFENPYIQRQLLTWKKIGLDPVPWQDALKPKTFFKLLASRNSNYSNINWLEDRIGYKKWPVIVDLVFIAMVAFMLRITSKRVIWTRHNATPHDGCSDRMYSFVCWFLGVLCDSTVVHAERESVEYDYVIAHPLYFDFPPEVFNSSRDFAFIGAIKPYKDLDLLLEVWPRHESLLVAGRCEDKAYESRIIEILDSRSLNVKLLNKYLPDKEIFEILKKTTFVVIPNSNQSMIASGVFYLAAACGVSVLCRRSSFSVFLEKNYSFVETYDFGSLDRVIAEKLSKNPDIVTKKNIQVEVFRKNGVEQCVRDWCKILELAQYE